MRTPFAPREHSLGHLFEQNELTAFFGGKNATIENVTAAFPDYRLLSIKQTHSDLVVSSPVDDPVALPEGDAHFTRHKKLALCIKTADCVPVLVHDPELGLVASIHAGWRGIENEIIRKTGAKIAGLQENSTQSLSRAHAWIGPHIGSRSFEVGREVAARLEARFDSVRGWSDVTSVLHPHADPAKAYVDLLAIAKAQLGSIGIDPERITILGIDTMTSQAHMSFRRDRETAGRQVSFIALK
jgi:YfiH family protein